MRGIHSTESGLISDDQAQRLCRRPEGRRAVPRAPSGFTLDARDRWQGWRRRRRQRSGPQLRGPGCIPSSCRIPLLRTGREQALTCRLGVLVPPAPTLLSAWSSLFPFGTDLALSEVSLSIGVETGRARTPETLAETRKQREPGRSSSGGVPFSPAFEGPHSAKLRVRATLLPGRGESPASGFFPGPGHGLAVPGQGP